MHGLRAVLPVETASGKKALGWLLNLIRYQEASSSHRRRCLVLALRGRGG